MNLKYYYSTYKRSLSSRLSLLLHGKKYKQFFAGYQNCFLNKYGLEIGGPSNLFTTKILPVYLWASTIDGVNFSNTTLWEGSIRSADYKYAAGKAGQQYILDGTALNGIADSKYDFLLSCHNLEHIANPLKAIKEWLRVLKPGGHILLVLPDKRFTFDHRRPYTTIDHLINDFEQNMQENDLSHLPEILELHDMTMDRGAGSNFEAFALRGKNNFENRGLHHHVFCQELLKQFLTYFDVNTVGQYFLPPFHQIIIGQRKK